MLMQDVRVWGVGKNGWDGPRVEVQVVGVLMRSTSNCDDFADRSASNEVG
jgi:hypothetical protein